MKGIGMLLGNPATETEKRCFRRLPSLLMPGYVVPEPTAAELAAKKARREVIATRRRRLDYVLAEYRRRYPAMVAREEAREAKEAEEIRQRVFGERTK